MLQKIKYGFICFLAVCVSACSHVYGENGYIKDRDYDYLRATSIPPLRIPPGYSSEKIQAKYPISNGNYSIAAARVDLTPPGLYSTGH